MPHKHTRRRGGNESSFDLPPSTLAEPLPTYDHASKSKTKQNGTLKRKRSVANDYKHNDTPRAFARMMQLQLSKKRPRSGLDDGNETRKSKKKQKTNVVDDVTTQEAAVVEPARSEIPKIMPGERLGDYAARVDHALPVGGLERKGKVKVDGIKERQTKTEKRLQKMYASWREEEGRLKEKEEERREQEEEVEAEREAALGGLDVRLPTGSRNRKRTKMIGEQADGRADDDDPWAELKLKRDRPKGLHDVVQAPPDFKALPKEKFKVRNGAKVNVTDVPVAAGSLRRREELSSARQEVIERYRVMMKKSE